MKNEDEQNLTVSDKSNGKSLQVLAGLQSEGRRLKTWALPPIQGRRKGRRAQRGFTIKLQTEKIEVMGGLM